MNRLEQIILEKPHRTHGGVHAPHRKNTALTESVRMPAPATVRIPMQMHIGAPCVPTVKVGDEVLVGQLIGDSDRPFSAPIHASVSGTVKEITKIALGGGGVSEAVVIASDGKMTPIPIAPPKVENTEDFVKAVRACGLVGLGGAGFPTHIKLNVPQGKKVDTLLINGAECEPYLTADNREILEDSWAVMSGIYAVKNMLGIHRVLICIEDNKPKAIEVLKEIASSSADEKDEVRVLSLHATYPQGAEKVLIKAATGREVPPGKLPADVGCIVMNVTSVAVLSRFLKTGMPLTEKRLTVDGGAIAAPKNVIVPIGTAVSEVIDFCGGFREEPGKVLFGGPMMGIALNDLHVPVVKNNNGIIALTREEAESRKATACIRCGRCMAACPMLLSPLMLERAVARGDREALTRYDVMSCMECGCCAFSCPASRPLVQAMRLGKALLREKK